MQGKVDMLIAIGLFMDALIYCYCQTADVHGLKKFIYYQWIIATQLSDADDSLIFNLHTCFLRSKWIVNSKMISNQLLQFMFSVFNWTWSTYFQTWKKLEIIVLKYWMMNIFDRLLWLTIEDENVIAMWKRLSWIDGDDLGEFTWSG